MNEIENAPCGSLTFSSSGIIQTINTTLQLQLKYDHKEELIGKSVNNIFTIAGKIFYQTHFFPLLQLQGKADEIFFSLQDKNKETLPVICNAVKIGLGADMYFHCIFMIVKERGKYEQEILAAKRIAEKTLAENKEMISVKEYLENQSIDLDRRLSSLRNINNDLTQFGVVVSHDLQESIRRISLLTEKIAQSAKQTLTGAELNSLERIKKECQKLRHLVANLEKYMTLNLSDGDFEPVDMNMVINEAYLAATRNGKTVDVIFTAASLPVIDGNKDQLLQLFYNLFDNSLKFRDQSRTLAITITDSVTSQNSFLSTKDKYKYSDFLKITFSDNGAGFDIKDEDHIFELLQKRGKTISFGFGLAFCKKIVDNHFGNIAATSEKGVGTIMDVFLPFTQHK